MRRASSARCWAADNHPLALDFCRPKHDIPAQIPYSRLSQAIFREGDPMTDPNRPKDDAAASRRATWPSEAVHHARRSGSRLGRGAGQGSRRGARQDAAHAGRDGKPAQADRAEVADARAYGITGFARDVLDIADNLQRALDAVPADAQANADPGLKALIEGVELTEKSLHKALEKNGVKKFDPAGEKFDPNFHQAMYEVPDPSVPVRHGRAGRAGRLHDRRAHPAPGAGRRRQRRRESRRVGIKQPTAVVLRTQGRRL